MQYTAIDRARQLAFKSGNRPGIFFTRAVDQQGLNFVKQGFQTFAVGLFLAQALLDDKKT